ncbi:uncharacterized protein F5891DRAFT_380520 [Suillus fuscotomentosus]|uniref:Nephrocystin 3-like N-terminal domain-containing protein n=1 Tax=Suillus fuscotomentosus TaxID=1912939 RepID=A0AAD4E5A3_9AGAM|nr:uncharacterized protein F5891DRAFT_380520 [Suillus fuscotomentosus]KAG1899840.1 hypothetical protein F5891DRAFT_380520 [Suillus fuscotomentosus]
MNPISERVTVVMPLLGRVKSPSPAQHSPAPVDLELAYNFQDTYIRPFKIFDSVVGTLTDVHPYTKIALLLQQLGQVYDFMMQDETLREIPSMQSIVGPIVQHTLKCSQFIRDYSTTKNLWKRLGKNILSETDHTIQQYIDVFQELMKRFQDRTAQNTSVQRTGDLPDLSGITYAQDAGLDPGKQCLPGTRMEILSEIIDWANSTKGNVQPVLWLSGPARKGKSAIAHTLANWFNNVGGLGSYYCFDRQRDAERLHEKIFSTIARDLADRDPGVKRALVDAVQHASVLKNTTDIIQQWHKLLMGPLGKLSRLTVRPVLIVIEALDESGGADTRRDLLRIIAGKPPHQGPQITDLPSNFRILVTSRPLSDIKTQFDGAQHILQLSMDYIPSEVTERDIHTYVSAELKGLSGIQEKQIAMLAAQADGLFDWARRACDYIKKGTDMDAVDALVKRDLYVMYRTLLAEIMATQNGTPEILAVFRSVMPQILGTVEPLSLISLNAMRDCIPDQSKHYKAEDIVQHMGSLLSGTTNPSTPIKPLHTSFREFLTVQASSGDFFVDISKAQRDLTFASLRVMRHGLLFNLCNLKSSHLLNREDLELHEQVERNIPPYLSYSCRFWSSHLRATVFDTELAEEVKSFFDHERLLFWLEVLGVIQAVSSAVTALPHIPRWLKDHSGYEDVSATAMDVHQFIQTFGGIILHSTPHLYVSALPFWAVNSSIGSKFASNFPNILRLVSRCDSESVAVQSLLGEYAEKVLSVSFSPDGTRIATGSVDKTVRLWDAATGQPIGEPLRGHTGAVSSVLFSPDGTRIASALAGTHCLGQLSLVLAGWDPHCVWFI